jgi:hypothetical protein
MKIFTVIIFYWFLFLNIKDKTKKEKIVTAFHAVVCRAWILTTVIKKHNSGVFYGNSKLHFNTQKSMIYEATVKVYYVEPILNPVPHFSDDYFQEMQNKHENK